MSRVLFPEIPRSRFSQVDGLRAIACASVIFSHTALGFVGIAQGGEWMAKWSMGRLGVLLFFAISGFVIPHSLRGLRAQAVKQFAIRRFWRLFPPYWFALALTAAWRVGSAYPLERLPWDATMLPHLRAFAGLQHPHGFLHFWTLEVELFFYFSVAGLYLLFGGLGWRVLFTVYIGLFLYTVTDSFPVGIAPEYSPVPSLMMMFWGAACREVLRFDFKRYPRLAPIKGVDWARSLLLGVVTFPLVFVGLQYAFYRIPEGWWNIETRVGASLLCAVVGFLFWVILTPVRLNWLSRVGRWTYSVYLLHFLVIYSVFYLLRINASVIPWISGWPLPVYMGGVLLICFAVGGVAYRWVEQPSDQVGKRLSKG